MHKVDICAIVHIYNCCTPFEKIMRTILILTFILTGFIGKAQVVVDSINGKIYVDRVQEIDLKKKQLKDKMVCLHKTPLMK